MKSYIEHLFAKKIGSKDCDHGKENEEGGCGYHSLFHNFHFLLKSCSFSFSFLNILCFYNVEFTKFFLVGFLFAPIVVLLLLCISSIRLHNIFHWNSHIYKVLSPFHMYRFLKKTQTGGWKSLGGILLCITGKRFLYKFEIVLLLSKVSIFNIKFLFYFYF